MLLLDYIHIADISNFAFTEDVVRDFAKILRPVIIENNPID